jgi:hypothetical protein
MDEKRYEWKCGLKLEGAGLASVAELSDEGL